MKIFRFGLSTVWLLPAVAFNPNDWLDLHNLVRLRVAGCSMWTAACHVPRCVHNTPILDYDDTLMDEAEAAVQERLLEANCPNPDLTSGDGLNVASCVDSGTTALCSTWQFAIIDEWYGQLGFYVPGATGMSSDPTEEIDSMTQVLWADTMLVGCDSGSCTFEDDETGPKTRGILVCRYRSAGNVAGEYLENVDPVPAITEEICINKLMAHGDPHMVGFQHQKFDFTGEDGEWYALIHDGATDMGMNMRITQPVPEVPEVTYITGLGLSILGDDDEVHAFEVVLNDPHNLEPECAEGDGHPCLVDGALTILVDGKEVGVGEVELGSGVYLSALNLPGECRPFGHEKYWLEKDAEPDVSNSRRLRAGSRRRKPFSPAAWIMNDRYRTDPEACDKYVQEASAAGTLFEHQSEHASLQITAPTISLRINIGKSHQKATRDPTDSFDIPDHVGYRINLAFESLDDVSLSAQGILGETIQLRHDEEGNPITSGPDCIRGEEPMYKVTGPLAKGFTLDI